MIIHIIINNNNNNNILVSRNMSTTMDIQTSTHLVPTSLCCQQMFEDLHLQQRQVLRAVLARADQVFTCLFLVEVLLKWIALGLNKYFSDAWSWIDFLILQVGRFHDIHSWF